MKKYNILFTYAHPDDESAGAGGLIYRLASQGHNVLIATATNGSAGEIVRAMQSTVSTAQLGTYREQELKKALEILGVTQHRLLGFADGSITNQDTWHNLKNSILAIMQEFKPDIVVTFDPSGWYYHLDHIAVSRATKLAIDETNEKPTVFMYNLFDQGFHESGRYNFSENVATTHKIKIDSKQKIAAIQEHKTQLSGITLDFVHYLEQQTENFEYFQLVHSSELGKSIVEELFY